MRSRPANFWVKSAIMIKSFPSRTVRSLIRHMHMEHSLLKRPTKKDIYNGETGLSVIYYKDAVGAVSIRGKKLNVKTGEHRTSGSGFFRIKQKGTLELLWK